MTRRGMTLIEMLVALTATLLLMAALAQAFSAFGNAITDSRSVLELDARMRTVAWRLRSDLAGITVRPLPPIGHESGEGYLEIIEGSVEDSDAADGLVVGGDHDDAILFTTRSSDEPFLGRYTTTMSSGASSSQMTQSRMIESPLAELAWFARATPGTSNPTMYTLYRKQLLVMGYLGFGPFGQRDYSYTTSGSHESLIWSSSWSDYFNAPFDVSVRLQGGRLYPNSLLDLTRRETRFAHNLTGTYGNNAVKLRFAGGNHQAQPAPDGLIFDSGSFREGEDVVLANVIAFDVRVFDPAAPVVLNGQTALVPGDPGFAGTHQGSGAYIDLGNGAATNTLLSARNIAPRFYTTGSGALEGQATYDTWSSHYEANGRNEDGGLVDGFNNGLDDNSDGAIDDANERETSPPYPWPLRGIEVRIRCYEPSSRQVRQVTVRHTFVPH
jgi:prepilin-type N-terminal cleavage/methylation domain-containing protein